MQEFKKNNDCLKPCTGCTIPTIGPHDVKIAFYKRLYNLFDINHDGDLSVDEVDDVMESYLKELSLETKDFLNDFLKELVNHVPGGSSSINFKTFKNILVGNGRNLLNDKIPMLEEFRKEKKGVNSKAFCFKSMCRIYIRHLFYPILFWFINTQRDTAQRSNSDPTRSSSDLARSSIEMNKLPSLHPVMKKEQTHYEKELEDDEKAHKSSDFHENEGKYGTYIFYSVMYFINLGSLVIYIVFGSSIGIDKSVVQPFEVSFPFYLYLVNGIIKSHVQSSTSNQQSIWLARKSLGGYKVFPSFDGQYSMKNAAELLTLIKEKAKDKIEKKKMMDRILKLFPLACGFCLAVLPSVQRWSKGRSNLNNWEILLVCLSFLCNVVYYYKLICLQEIATRRYLRARTTNHVFRSLTTWTQPYLDLRFSENIIAWSRVNKFLNRWEKLNLWHADILCGYAFSIVILFCVILVSRRFSASGMSNFFLETDDIIDWMLFWIIATLSVVVSVVLSLGAYMNTKTKKTYRYLVAQRFKLWNEVAHESYEKTVQRRIAVEGLESLAQIVRQEKGFQLLHMPMTLVTLRVFWTFLMFVMTLLLGDMV